MFQKFFSKELFKRFFQEVLKGFLQGLIKGWLQRFLKELISEFLEGFLSEFFPEYLQVFLRLIRNSSRDLPEIPYKDFTTGSFQGITREIHQGIPPEILKEFQFFNEFLEEYLQGLCRIIRKNLVRILPVIRESTSISSRDSILEFLLGLKK